MSTSDPRGMTALPEKGDYNRVPSSNRERT
jgi:hypothetical protein